MIKMRNIEHIPRGREVDKLIVDETIIILPGKRLKIVHLNLLFKRVGIYRSFSIKGEIVPELRS